MGGQAATQVIQGEKLFDLVVRMKPEFRENAQEIGNLLVGTPSGQQIPLRELANIHEANGASFIYRENNSRYIGVQFSIEGRDLAERGRRGPARHRRRSEIAAAGLPARLGRRVQRVARSEAPDGNHRSAGAAADLHDPVRALRQFQIPGGNRDRRGDDRAGRRADRAEADAHAVQRVVRARACWR